MRRSSSGAVAISNEGEVPKGRGWVRAALWLVSIAHLLAKRRLIGV
jgi:hypothetical protein